MGLIEWFAYRSPKQRRRDSRRYDRWAFPYGEAQHDAIAALLAQLFPRESPKIAMARYLIGREGGTGDYQDDPEDHAGRTEYQTRLYAAKRLKGQMRGAEWEEIALYLALIEADLAIDEALHYPDAAQLRERVPALVQWMTEQKKQKQL